MSRTRRKIMRYRLRFYLVRKKKKLIYYFHLSFFLVFQSFSHLNIFFCFSLSLINRSAWSPCVKMSGTRTRTITITSQPMNNGQSCPPPETEKCLVDCTGEWGCWSPCSSISSNGATPPFKRKRNYVIQIYAKNGGASCPTEESSSCVPDVCYSAESTSSSFGAKKMGMRPIRTLPVGHPGLSRTDCGGPLLVREIFKPIILDTIKSF